MLINALHTWSYCVLMVQFRVLIMVMSTQHVVDFVEPSGAGPIFGVDSGYE